MKDVLSVYYKRMFSLEQEMKVTARGRKKTLDLASGFEKTVKHVMDVKQNRKKVMFIGNGGSAAISSHMAVDFWKNGNIKALSFNDASLLTCVANDFGYEHVFEKPIERFAEKGDLLFAISSSGKSENIIRGVQAGDRAGCSIITLSGFSSRNPLRGLGNINFYIPSTAYGFVEIIHLTICHCVLDHIMETTGG